MTPDAYWTGVVPAVERLLTNMDRNRASDTFGCLCRPYWQDKVMDFPSAHQQIGVLPLALVYTQDRPENPFFQEDELKEYIDAAMTFWADIQRRHGGFDEHYPNEHSLGATAWTLWAVTAAHHLIDDPPDIRDAIERAVAFLSTYDEPGELANHQAVAASALCHADSIVDVEKGAVSGRIDRVQEMQHSEGWFSEYGGADIGYQTTTLSHLGRVWSADAELVPDEMIRKGLSFLRHFLDSEGYYAGIIGSRATRHLHTAGIERFTERFEDARRLAYCARKHIGSGTVLEPHQMDDKHFSRLLAERLDAYRCSGTVKSPAENVEGETFEHITIRRCGDTLVFINMDKGAVYERYETGDLVERDYSIARRINGSVYTAHWPGATKTVTRDEDTVRVEGELHKVPRNTNGGVRFLASRLFTRTVGQFPRVSLAIKRRLISHLISGNSAGYRFTRSLQLSDDGCISVSDTCEAGTPVGGKIRCRFVPSAEYAGVDDVTADTSNVES